MTTAYRVSVQRAAPRTIAAIHARLPARQISTVFARYLDQVYATGRAGAIQLDGQNIFLYRAVADQPDVVDVAFGVGIKSPFAPIGEIRPTDLPEGDVATATHWGSYAGLGAAHAAVVDWCRVHGYRRAGASWEVYGHWTDDEKQLRTDVYYLVQPAT